MVDTASAKDEIIVEAFPETSSSRGGSIHINRQMLFGIIIVFVIVAIALLAPLLTVYDPYAQNLPSRRIPPVWYAWLELDSKASWTHPLGTDKLGRDYWARLAYGARISLLIGLSTSLVSCLIGSAMGIAAGFWGGKVDAAVNLIVQTRLAMPIMIIALAAVAILGPSLQTTVLVMSLLLWERSAILSRAATQQLVQQDFVRAAHAVGCNDLQIILHDILPNLKRWFFIIFALETGHAVLLEASLSFLGLGIRPPLPSWGLMLADAKDDMLYAPWAIALPGGFLFLLLLGTTLLSSSLRDDRGL